MRDKEAMEIEKKSFLRMLEKQGKAVERLVDTEGSLNAQIVSHYSLLCCQMYSKCIPQKNLLEKETAMQRKMLESLKDNLRQQERVNTELMGRMEVERSRVDSVRTSTSTRSTCANWFDHSCGTSTKNMRKVLRGRS